MTMFDEFKNAFNRPNNTLVQLIIINVAVFVVLALLRVVGEFGAVKLFTIVYNQISIPPLFSDFITRPWTLLTYSFAHSLSGIFHILFNMLALYWFGRVVVDYVGSNRLLHLYIYGAIAGAIVYLVSYNLIPFYAERAAVVSGMVGASAAVFAIAVGAAVLAPDYMFYMLLIGPVKIKYIVAVYVFLSVIGMVGANAGGNIAHLGGAALGFVYISQLRSGVDWGRPINYVIDFFRALFKPSSPIKVTHRKSSNKSKGFSSSDPTPTSNVSQAEIDAILDKISEKGYESLSKEEKEKLFNASK